MLVREDTEAYYTSNLKTYFSIDTSTMKGGTTATMLTHLPLDKMAAILTDDNYRCILLNENDRIPIRLSLKFLPRGPLDNKPALVQVMAWHRTGDKPLHELMPSFTDAYMRHSGEMS